MITQFIMIHVNNSVNHVNCVNSVNSVDSVNSVNYSSGPRVRQSIRKYSWTPACDSQLENSPGPPRATVNLKIILDTRVRQ